MRITGAEALVESLLREGVEIIFGYPGGQALPIYDALFSAPIRHILTRHEQAAAHAADGYARTTGKPGVVLATSGPGATNLVTGLATAYMDSIPIIAFTGQVPTTSLGRDSFQEADITGITIPITKHNYLVKEVKDLPRIVKEAFHIATTGRPGPVLIDLPKDIAVAKLKFEYPEEVRLPGYKPTYTGNARQVKEAAQVITEAKRPVIYAGGGVVSSGAENELLALAELIQAPVTATLLGIAAFPTGHPLALGMPGMHGAAYANYAITEADLLIAVGARFDDRVTGRVDAFAPKARIIHIDIDPAEIGKNVRVDVPIVGDARRVLAALLENLSAQRRPEWLAQIEAWKKEYPLDYARTGPGIKPQAVIEAVNELTGGEAIIVTEVGQHQMWAAQYCKVKRPRSFISSGGLGTMGYGFPAAIGAQIGNPGRTVIDIAGDGSFQMNIQELATAVANELPVKVFILNNACLGMVRQWQELFFNKRYSASLLPCNPDFVRVAEAYGATGLRAAEPAAVLPAMREALAAPGPVVVDFVVEQEENVFPMVPANGPIHKMLGVGKE
ncbi:MAG: biosynthetic-type acetolactate synthase large subunit [Patescibacteria group bacterium]